MKISNLVFKIWQKNSDNWQND